MPVFSQERPTLMDRLQLKLLQAPLKEHYQAQPEQAVARLHARGTVDFQQLTCHVPRPPGNPQHAIAGLHPKAGGSTSVACSGDMLLQALVSCAGVTLAAVATSMGLPIEHAEVEALGSMDFRGTLGIDRNAPVGLTAVELVFHIKGTATDDQLDKLLQLVERYCVVLQTLKHGVTVVSRRTP